MIGEPDEIRVTTPGPAADRGLRVNTIGFGSADGGDFDPL
jgi:hypothetical protein